MENQSEGNTDKTQSGSGQNSHKGRILGKGILEDIEDELENQNEFHFEEFKTPAQKEDKIEFDLAVTKKKQKNLGGRDRLYSSSEIIKPQ